jgi:hypothetical protein
MKYQYELFDVLGGTQEKKMMRTFMRGACSQPFTTNLIVSHQSHIREV